MQYIELKIIPELQELMHPQEKQIFKAQLDNLTTPQYINLQSQ